MRWNCRRFEAAGNLEQTNNEKMFNHVFVSIVIHLYILCILHFYKLYVTLYINAKWFDTSDAFHGGLAVAISMRQQPKDQMSQDLP